MYVYESMDIFDNHSSNTPNNPNKSSSLKVGKLKLMKGKALRKHSLHEKTAASVLLKLFISGNE